MVVWAPTRIEGGGLNFACLYTGKENVKQVSNNVLKAFSGWS